MSADFELKRFETCSQLYMAVLNDRFFQIVFVIGCVFYYILELIGAFLYSKYLSPLKQKSISKYDFAGNVASIVHSLTISFAALLFVYTFKFGDRASDSYENSLANAVNIYRYCSTFSISYFVIDLYFTLRMDKQSKYIMSLHHVLSGLMQMPPLISPPSILYVTALEMCIEISTIFLNVRVFGKVFRNTSLYYVSGFTVLVTYPLFRLAFSFYVIYATLISDIGYMCPSAINILVSVQLFIVCLSLLFFGRMMKRPSVIYILSEKLKKK